MNEQTPNVGYVGYVGYVGSLDELLNELKERELTFNEEAIA